jgi:hypothetical protein
MIDFDKTKYPLDHEWEDKFPNIDKNKFGNIYDTYYVVQCLKCNIRIQCEEVNSNKTKSIYKVNQFVVSDGISHDTIYSVYNSVINSVIDYTKVYSCAEMMIKKLLE